MIDKNISYFLENYHNSLESENLGEDVVHTSIIASKDDFQNTFDDVDLYFQYMECYYPQKGLGRKVLSIINRELDALDLSIGLMAQSHDPKITKEKLAELYSEFGFENSLVTEKAIYMKREKPSLRYQMNQKI